MGIFSSRPAYHRAVTKDLGGPRLSSHEGRMLQKHLGHLYPVASFYDPEAPFALAQSITLVGDSAKARRALSELHLCLTSPPHPHHPARSEFMRQVARGMVYMATHFNAVRRDVQEDAARLMKEHVVLLPRRQQEQVREAISAAATNSWLLGVAETLDQSLSNDCPDAGRAHQHTILKVLDSAHPEEIYNSVFATDDPKMRGLQKLMMQRSPRYRAFIGIGDPEKLRKEKPPVMHPYFGPRASPPYGRRPRGPIGWLWSFTTATQQWAMRSAAELIGHCIDQVPSPGRYEPWPSHMPVRRDSMRYFDSYNSGSPPYRYDPRGLYANYRPVYPWANQYGFDGPGYGGDNYNYYPNFYGEIDRLTRRLWELEMASRGHAPRKTERPKKRKKPAA